MVDSKIILFGFIAFSIIIGIILFKFIKQESFRVWGGGPWRGRGWGWGSRPWGWRRPWNWYSYAPAYAGAAYAPVYNPDKCFCDNGNLTYNGCSDGKPLCYGDQCYCNKCQCEDGKVKSVIEKNYSFEQTPDAFRQLENGHMSGKIVITVA